MVWSQLIGLVELFEPTLDHLKDNIDLCLDKDPLLQALIPHISLVQHGNAKRCVCPIHVSLKSNAEVRLERSIVIPSVRFRGKITCNVLNLRLNLYIALVQAI